VDIFRSLRHRNYRLYFLGQFVSVTGSWAQSAALTWLAYDLTKESSWPALVAAMQVLPTCVLGAWGGSLADRLPKRSLIFLAQATLLLLAVLLGVLALTGGVTSPWPLLAIATAAGIVNAIDLPARLAFVIDLVGREDLPNAIALNSMLFNVARCVGPIVSAGTFSLAEKSASGQTAAGACFLLNGLSFVAVLAALAWMDLPPHESRTAKHDTTDSLWAGFRYLAQHPKLILLLVLSGAMSLFGWPILSLLPAVADQRLGASENGYFWMLGAIGVGGALIASPLVASFSSRVRGRWFLAAGVALSSSSLLCLAATRSSPLAVAYCTVLGCGLILFFPTSQSIMQLSSDNHVRGRVMGIWSMVLSGAYPLGHLLAGQAADRWGVPLVLNAMGAGIVVASVVVALLALTWRERRQEG
jgi:MFS family permease